MVNILLVDIFYEIDGALWQAARLTTLGVFLLLSDWNGFKTYFLKAYQQVLMIPAIIPQKIKKLYWLKFLIIPLMAWYAYTEISDSKEKFLVKNELHGIWRNISHTDHTQDRLYKITFDYDNGVKIKDFSKNFYYGNIVLDTTKKVVTLHASHYSDEAYYFVNDSIRKLSASDQENEALQKQIRDYYHTVNHSVPFEKEVYTYHKKRDTLILYKEGKNPLIFINSTKDYIPN